MQFSEMFWSFFVSFKSFFLLFHIKYFSQFITNCFSSIMPINFFFPFFCCVSGKYQWEKRKVKEKTEKKLIIDVQENNLDRKCILKYDNNLILNFKLINCENNLYLLSFLFANSLLWLKFKRKKNYSKQHQIVLTF